MFKKGVLVLLVLSTTLLLMGCGKRESGYGEAIPNNVEVVKLEKILQNPKEYKDKEVVLEGNFGGICCGGGFFYKEGTEVIEFYYRGPMPRLTIGKPIRIFGTIRVIRQLIYIEAKGVETR